MDNSTPFKWRHFEADIILLCVRCYLRYSLSYRMERDLVNNWL
jgi:transposase, IS6 family